MPSSAAPSEENGKIRVQLIRALRPGHAAELSVLLSDIDVVRNVPENDFREHLSKAAAIGNEEAVRLLLKAGAKTDVTAGAGPLHRAIKNQTKKSRNAIVKLLIEHGCQIDFQDAEGATPLMVACLRGQDDVVKTLLDRGADPDFIHDETGKNILHKMATEAAPTFQWSPDTLALMLSKVTDLNRPDHDGRSPLLSAAASGQLALAGALLRCKGENGVDVNQTNEQGHSALHLAARKNQPAMIKLLLLSGAKIEARSDGGWTPLLSAAKEGHEPAVDALLTHGANINASTSTGMTSLHWAAENGKVATVRRLLRVPDCSKNGKDSFDCTPLIRAAQNGYWNIVEDLRPHVLAEPSTSIARRACHRFRGSVVSFFADDKMKMRSRVDKHTVFQILYARDPDNADNFAIPTVVDNIKTKKPLFRWIHLPSNNVAWLEALLTKHFLESNSKDVSGFKSLLRLLGRQQHRGAEVHSRFMRPLCKRIWAATRTVEATASTPRRSSHTNRGDSRSGVSTPPRVANGRPQVAASPRPQSSQEEDIMALFMPYLHWETDGNRRSLAESIKAPTKRTSLSEDPRSPRIPRDILLIDGYIDESTDLHPRRTLDQFKHHGASTEAQDADQVVYRYCLRNNQELKIFMVDQLWLVIIGDLLITCFPERWDQPRRDPLNLFDGVIEDVNSTTRPPVRSVYELATLVTERCNGMFDRHQWGHDEFLFAEMFELSIGLITRKETALFRRFKNDSVVAAHWLRPQRRNSALYQQPYVGGQSAYASEQYLFSGEEPRLTSSVNPTPPKPFDSDVDEFVNRLLNIDEEAALLVECKDIEDELEILASVLRQQKQVLTDMEAIFRGSRMLSSPLRLDLYKTINEQQKQVDLDILDLTRMARQAKSVNDNLTQVLDLKQKHASAVEARFQRIQAQETARQGRTIMVFTIVTIIFLPLSFLASFFALNIIEFPHLPRSDGGGTGLHLGWVIKYILGIGLGLSIPLIGLAFVVGDIRAWWAGRKPNRYHTPARNFNEKISDEGFDDVHMNEDDPNHRQSLSWLTRRLRRRKVRRTGDDDLTPAENGTAVVHLRPKLPAMAVVEGVPCRQSTHMPVAAQESFLSPPRQPTNSTYRTDRDSTAVRGLRRTPTARTDVSLGTDDLEIGRP
jgi:ankyrin repeat protein